MSDSTEQIVLSNPLTVAGITAVAPHVDALSWAAILASPMVDIQCNTPERIAMFVGQIAAECNWIIQHEDLTYETASRLQLIYPREFPTIADAEPYVKNPEKLANFVYAGRLGNGNVASGDGWLFRGGGLLQLTGRGNYENFGTVFGKSAEEAAAWVQTMEGAANSACWFWTENNINDLADMWQVTATTKLINGSTISAPQRVKLCNAALNAMDGIATQATATS